LVKREIRIIGIDAQERPVFGDRCVAVGAICRGALWLDGILATHLTYRGVDSTDRLAGMIMSSAHFAQLRAIMLNGFLFSGLNVVNIRRLNRKTGLPVIALTSRRVDIEKLVDSAMKLPSTRARIEAIRSAGEPFQLRFNRIGTLYVNFHGVTIDVLREIVTVSRGSSCEVEPLRVARILISAVTRFQKMWDSTR
jgi:endonuclease V-like protein UPF0215 family